LIPFNVRPGALFDAISDGLLFFRGTNYANRPQFVKRKGDAIEDMREKRPESEGPMPPEAASA
jgi:hypothetical protein